MDSEEDSGDYWPEEAADGGDIKKPDYSAATDRRRQHYKILNEEDIKHLQENDISTVSDVLAVPRGIACALLCRNNWSLISVYEEWFAAADGGERNPDTAANPAEQESIELQICKICHEINTLPNSAVCGHLFCADCWKTYIAAAIGGGPGCLTLQCPEPGCGAAVTSDTIERFASEAEIKKYHQYLRRSYVESNRERKWCPATGCGRAVEFDAFCNESYDVVCDCSHSFCWGCGEERHRPVDCKAVAAWTEKRTSEAETTNWILAYTKPCPKCRLPIEKNEGCNHMMCIAPCNFEFCWMCSGAWGSHGGSVYSCDYYVEDEEGERIRMKARRSIERYNQCYERWDSNDKSRKAAVEDLERARRKYGGGIGRKMEFVVEAWEHIVECRRVLKWSYVYGYYLPESEVEKVALLEHLQAAAELAVELLRHCVETGIMDKVLDVDYEEFREFRAKLLVLAKVTRNYFENLVVALENDLAEVGSCVYGDLPEDGKTAVMENLQAEMEAEVVWLDYVVEPEKNAALNSEKEKLDHERRIKGSKMKEE